MFPLSDKVKSAIGHFVSAAAFIALGVSILVGWDMSWWQPTVAAVAVILHGFFGIKWSAPER
jgi:hypothetical protein